MAKEFDDYLLDLEAAGFRVAARRLRKINDPVVEDLQREGELPESLKEMPIVYEHADFSHSIRDAIVKMNGQEIQLNPKENILLRLLEQRPNKTCPFDYLLMKIWGPDYVNLGYGSGHLRGLAYQLRGKIEPEKRKGGGRYNSSYKYIVTEPGTGCVLTGYVLKDPSKPLPEGQRRDKNR